MVKYLPFNFDSYLELSYLEYFPTFIIVKPSVSILILILFPKEPNETGNDQ